MEQTLRPGLHFLAILEQNRPNKRLLNVTQNIDNGNNKQFKTDLQTYDIKRRYTIETDTYHITLNSTTSRYFITFVVQAYCILHSSYYVPTQKLHLITIPKDEIPFTYLQ